MRVRHPLFLIGVVVGGLILACGGGENPNQQSAGSQEGGVTLGVGDIAVSTDGSYVVFSHGDGLAVGWTQTGTLELLSPQDPSVLAFANTSPTIFVGQESADTVVAVDVSSGAELWEAPVESASKEVLKLDVSATDGLLVTHDEYHLRVLDPATGLVLYDHVYEKRIVDVDIVDTRLFVVLAEVWHGDSPISTLEVIDTTSWQASSHSIPNCAATLSLMPLAQRAFMAPTSCSQDPVSVISLVEGAEGFERNLPGFGPVAVSSDGWTAVAFYSVSQGDESLFEDPTQMPAEDSAEYHLMIIDGADLSYRFAEYGDTLPRFSVAPDGQVILVDGAFNEAPTTLFDLETGTFRSVEGPELYLDHYALSSDGAMAYVLHPDTFYEDQGLYALDLRSAVAVTLATPFIPTNLNLSPDDATLFLRENEQRVCVYALSDQTCQTWFDADQLDSDTGGG